MLFRYSRYYDTANGDTSHCTFVFNITWRDGGAPTTETLIDPTASHHLVGEHTYTAPGVYTITVTVQVTVGAGTCTGTNSVHTFTLLPPTPTGPATNAIWSGYVKQADATTVKGTWKVPKLTCSLGQLPEPTAPQWVGLGGVNGNPDLEQTGIFTQCGIGHTQIIYPVWEILSKGDNPNKPQTPVLGLFAVWPGDVIDASVTKNGDKYNFMIHDHGQGTHHPAWTWKSTQVQKDGGATPPTAEWIVERAGAGAPLAPFGTVTFSDCSYGPKLNASSATQLVITGSNGQPLTSVSGNGDTIEVKYIPQ